MDARKGIFPMMQIMLAAVLVVGFAAVTRADNISVGSQDVAIGEDALGGDVMPHCAAGVPYVETDSNGVTTKGCILPDGTKTVQGK
jgi:hypothetical protein